MKFVENINNHSKTVSSVPPNSKGTSCESEHGKGGVILVLPLWRSTITLLREARRWVFDALFHETISEHKITLACMLLLCANTHLCLLTQSSAFELRIPLRLVIFCDLYTKRCETELSAQVRLKPIRVSRLLLYMCHSFLKQRPYAVKLHFFSDVCVCMCVG